MKTSTARAFRWLALLLLILGIGAMSFGAATAPTSPTATAPENVDSTRVAEILEQRPDDDDGGAAIVLFTGDGPLDPGALGSKAAELGGPLIPNEDLSAALVPVTVESEGLSDNADRVAQLRSDAAADLPAGVTAQVTGPAAIQADLAGVFEGANFLLLAVTGAIVAVLLIITYRSPSCGSSPSWSSASPTVSPRSPSPGSSTPSAPPGTNPPPASSPCSSSAQAPTTPCC